MALTRVQKKGRVFGMSPVDDSRVIDQFMDDVIVFINNVVIDLTGSGDGDTVKVLINRRISENLSIADETACVQRDPIIEDGINVVVADGGELFIL